MNTLVRPLLIYKTIWNLFRNTKKRLFIIFLIVSLVVSFLEFLSIILFMNIINFVTLRDLPILSKFHNYLNLDQFLIEELFYLISALFLLVIVFVIILRFMINIINCKISYGVIYDFNNLIFKKLAYLNYLDHKKININSSISTLSKINDIIVVFTSNLLALSSLIMGVGIVISLLFLDWYLVLMSTLIIFLIYFILTVRSKKQLYRNSKIISENINIKTNSVATLLSSIRNVILDKLQIFFVKGFSDSDMKITKASTSNAVISSIPSMIFVNLVLFIFVAILVSNVSLGLNFIDDISKYATLAFGAQKIMPLLNNIYVAISRSRSGYHIVFSILTFIEALKNQKEPKKLKKKILDKKKITIKKKLVLRNIKFGYPNRPKIINNLNLNANLGDKILIQGESGVGKTTLIDIITGLITPIHGQLKIDNKIIGRKNLECFQKNISLVPQDVFLAEQSFLQNIALGIPLEEIKLQKVELCSKIAEINEFIEKTKNKYNSLVSHNGSNLSGGQKQRIGIARGLYKDSDILIFDESTSSLDDKTEKKIFKNFNKYLKKKIVIFISHNKKNIIFFNKIFTLVNGKLIRTVV
jgi:ABC-type multidrug transport system fused ATPase/permease subunit